MSAEGPRNIVWSPSFVTPAERAGLLGQQGAVLWLTGLSGSGKSTIARALERVLVERGRAAYVLDGDNIRHGLNADLGFSAAERDENIRRIGQVAALFADAGLIVITAFISPFRAAREQARKAAGDRPFLEVHVRAPIDVCRERDPKGLYARADRGEIRDFTGIDSPYEQPAQCDLTLDTGTLDLAACVQALVELLVTREIIPPSTRRNP